MSKTIRIENNGHINYNFNKDIYQITFNDGCFNENVKTVLVYDINKLKNKFNKKIKTKITQKTFNFYQITRINNNNKIILKDIKILNLQYCNIIKIENNSFVKLENLEILDLSSNNISTLEPNAFNGLNSLKKLLLMHSKINKIESNAFNDLNSLEILNLIGNQISTIEPNIFNGLNSLKELYLIGNPINHIKSYAFNNLSNLTNLYFGQEKESEEYTIELYAFNNLNKKCKILNLINEKLYINKRTYATFNNEIYYKKNYNVSFLSYLGLDKKQRPYYFNLDIDILINKIDLIKKLITKINNKVNIFRKCFVNYMNYVKNIINKSNNYKLNNKSNNYKLNNINYKLNNINYKESNELIKKYNNGNSVILKDLSGEKLIDLFITACIINEEKNNLIAKIFYTILEIYSSDPGVEKYIKRRKIIIDYIEKEPAITNKIKSVLMLK